MTPYWTDGQAAFYHGDVMDVMRELPDGAAQMCVTSPPYWGLRDYGVSGQLGLEPTPEVYITKMVAVFHEVNRVLRDDGTCWINIGDSYASGATGRNDSERDTPGGRGGSFRGGQRHSLNIQSGTKPKDLVGIPWMLAFALRADGWYLRQDIIWAKPNPMPESVTDRCTKSHEYLFLLSKSARYYYDADAIAEQTTDLEYRTVGKIRPTADPLYAQTGDAGAGRYRANLDTQAGGRTTRNKRSVWTIATEPYPDAHFATYPTALVTPCVLAGTSEGDTVLDPFIGSGTTAWVAKSLGRKSIGIDLSAEYLDLAVKRNQQMGMVMS